MSDDAQLHRDFGRLEGRVEGIERRTADMQEKVDEIHEALMQAQGGWKFMVAMGGFGAVVGGLIVKASAVLGWMR